VNTEELNKILNIMTVQEKAVQLLKSIKNTSDLNHSLSGIRAIKISENLMTQIHYVLDEIERIKT
jgi:hypothetical protein